MNDETSERIWETKQKLTLEYIEKYIKCDYEKIELLKTLKEQNFLLACASNCIKKTLYVILDQLCLTEYFDLILSNEDVKFSKPSAEIYLKTMLELNCNPTDTLIIEDSQIGYEAASLTKADVLRVINSKEVTYDRIKNSIFCNDRKIMKQKYKNNKLS